MSASERVNGGGARAAFWPGVVALGLATGYLIALLAAEKQAIIIALLAGGIGVVVIGAWFRLFDRVSGSFVDHEDGLGR